MSQPELSKGYAGSVNLDDEEGVVQVLTQSVLADFLSCSCSSSKEEGSEDHAHTETSCGRQDVAPQHPDRRRRNDGRYRPANGGIGR
jgi:hypothetical protein